MIRKLHHLLRDTRAAAAVEFALVAPPLLLMILGVFQAAMVVQNYNAMRNAVADVSRRAMIQYETGNGGNWDNTTIANVARGIAEGVPYMLEDSRLNVQCVTSSTQQVAGAKEVKVTMTYQANTFLKYFGIGGPYLVYSQPIFLYQ